MKIFKLLIVAFFAMISTVSWSRALDVDFTGEKTVSTEKPLRLLPGVMKASETNSSISVSEPVDSESGESLKGFIEKSVKKVTIKPKTTVPQRKISFEGESKEKAYEPYFESINCSESGKHWTVTETEWVVKGHHAQDVYMCEYLVTWNSKYSSCRESNPQTNPGVCNCRVDTFKGGREPTGRCEWSPKE